VYSVLRHRDPNTLISYDAQHSGLTDFDLLSLPTITIAVNGDAYIQYKTCNKRGAWMHKYDREGYQAMSDGPQVTQGGTSTT